jgi:hypothetical protein
METVIQVVSNSLATINERVLSATKLGRLVRKIHDDKGARRSRPGSLLTLL